MEKSNTGKGKLKMGIYTIVMIGLIALFMIFGTITRSLKPEAMEPPYQYVVGFTMVLMAVGSTIYFPLTVVHYFTNSKNKKILKSIGVVIGTYFLGILLISSHAWFMAPTEYFLDILSYNFSFLAQGAFSFSNFVKAVLFVTTLLMNTALLGMFANIFTDCIAQHNSSKSE